MVVGDLRDPQAVDRAVAGTRFVVHAGATMKGGWEEHHAGTVVGTKNVVESCIRHAVEKLVHISSMSVVHWAERDRTAPVTEETPLEPRPTDRGAYTRAKLEAETVVVHHAKERALNAVILRPGQIFGAGIPLLTGAVGRRMGGVWLILGDGRMRLPLVYVDDVVDAIEMAIRSELRNGQIVQLIDEHELTQLDILQLAAGPDLKIVRVPRGIIMALGWLAERSFGALGLRPPVSTYRLSSALADRQFKCQRARQLLGWSPRTGVHAGIRAMSSTASEARLNGAPSVAWLP